jgi:2-polyprenyl-3-methyl-5-hydroxy-6-metoxy-1,4-benzoquinol methylase
MNKKAPPGINRSGGNGVKTWSTPVREENRDAVPCALCALSELQKGKEHPGGACFRPYLKCGGFSYVRCTRCGLVQINPQPLPSEVKRRYREEHGEDYLSYEIANEKAFLRLQELALRDAGFYGPGEGTGEGGSRRVLDVGCATGALLETLRDRGWDVTGVEISSQEAEYARRERRLDVKTLSLEENRFPAGSFTVVLASHLVEHLNDPASFVREARRILIPGGRFFVTTPNIGGFQARLFRGRWRSAIFDHLYLFSAKTLRALLLGAGFRVERIVTWGGLAAGLAPAPVKALADRAAKRFGFGDVMIIRAAVPGPSSSG